MKYPLIHKLGLRTLRVLAEDNKYMVFADTLESLLASATRVYGDVEDMDWNGEKRDFDTHTALLLAVEPIRKGVTKSEIIEAMRKRGDNLCQHELNRIADRIEAEGIIDE